MPTTTPQQAFPVMVDGDDPDIPEDIMALALAIEKRVVGVHNNVAARDAAVTSPEEGQVAYLKDSNKLTYYTGSAWADVLPTIPNFSTGTTVPLDSSGTNGDVFFKI